MSLVSRGEKAINERYRPMRFSEVIGCDKTKDALTKWMNQGEKRSRAILLHGISGGGKTTIARIMAMGLNCEHGDTVEPCLECPSCKSAISGEAMHIQEYNMSALTRKEDADEIINSLSDSCFTGRNKVLILDEVQGMSTSSQNLILKSLENPPANTYLILCTTNPEKLLKTVRNRCEQYEFKNPTYDDIKVILGSIVKQEMPEMNLNQRKEILEACRGLSYREILMKLEKFIKGGGTDSISEAFQANYFDFCKLIALGKFADAMIYIEKNEDDFDIEAARRMIRSYFCSSMVSESKANGSRTERYYRVCRIFDKGFYTDPNPMPSFKMDVYEACRVMV